MRGRALAAAALFALAADAGAVTLYKWVDAQGRVQYGDRPPKNFPGEVTRIDTDPAATTLPSAPAAVPAAPAGSPEAAPKASLATERRARRERLAEDLSRARERLESARKALAEAGSPEPEERQVIQQRLAAGGNAQPQPIANTDPTQVRQAGGGMHGMAPRSNCRPVTAAGGAKSVICPTMVPGEVYFDRLRRLEEAVAAAEREVELAERAYRRGVD